MPVKDVVYSHASRLCSTDPMRAFARFDYPESPEDADSVFASAGSLRYGIPYPPPVTSRITAHRTSRVVPVTDPRIVGLA